ncbi:uncharacterized protein BDR25DRAFT_358013 [Lindgomyces ingoldianus]|uniref:Uncharacterized protein n=1 Tax=Lindgomyces ingoldianus TaxID=673940 RepID=A0ACB6QPS2_9PLEO|nr:uncharacterized protein BDR25DRAFT_358013 [Lindgomyces ingoldianus]KAF2468282.1 hypothetical protein BDR25DRAFT_358013 [Lindgomyces ingoldianus]
MCPFLTLILVEYSKIQETKQAVRIEVFVRNVCGSKPTTELAFQLNLFLCTLHKVTWGYTVTNSRPPYTLNTQLSRLRTTRRFSKLLFLPLGPPFPSSFRALLGTTIDQDDPGIIDQGKPIPEKEFIPIFGSKTPFLVWILCLHSITQNFTANYMKSHRLILAATHSTSLSFPKKAFTPSIFPPNFTTPSETKGSYQIFTAIRVFHVSRGAVISSMAYGLSKVLCLRFILFYYHNQLYHLSLAASVCASQWSPSYVKRNFNMNSRSDYAASIMTQAPTLSPQRFTRLNSLLFSLHWIKQWHKTKQLVVSHVPFMAHLPFLYKPTFTTMRLVKALLFLGALFPTALAAPADASVKQDAFIQVIGHRNPATWGGILSLWIQPMRSHQSKRVSQILIISHCSLSAQIHLFQRDSRKQRYTLYLHVISRPVGSTLEPRLWTRGGSKIIWALTREATMNVLSNILSLVSLTEDAIECKIVSRPLKQDPLFQIRVRGNNITMKALLHGLVTYKYLKRTEIDLNASLVAKNSTSESPFVILISFLCKDEVTKQQQQHGDFQKLRLNERNQTEGYHLYDTGTNRLYTSIPYGEVHYVFVGGLDSYETPALIPSSTMAFCHRLLSRPSSLATIRSPMNHTQDARRIEIHSTRHTHEAPYRSIDISKTKTTPVSTTWRNETQKKSPPENFVSDLEKLEACGKGKMRRAVSVKVQSQEVEGACGSHIPVPIDKIPMNISHTKKRFSCQFRHSYVLLSLSSSVALHAPSTIFLFSVNTTAENKTRVSANTLTRCARRVAHHHTRRTKRDTLRRNLSTSCMILSKAILAHWHSSEERSRNERRVKKRRVRKKKITEMKSCSSIYPRGKGSPWRYLEEFGLLVLTRFLLEYRYRCKDSNSRANVDMKTTNRGCSLGDRESHVSWIAASQKGEQQNQNESPSPKLPYSPTHYLESPAIILRYEMNLLIDTQLQKLLSSPTTQNDQRR